MQISEVLSLCVLSSLVLCITNSGCFGPLDSQLHLLDSGSLQALPQFPIKCHSQRTVIGSTLGQFASGLSGMVVFCFVTSMF